MRHPSLPRRWRWPLLVSLAGGLLAALAAWAVLPPEPRAVVPGSTENVLFTPDSHSFLPVPWRHFVGPRRENMPVFAEAEEPDDEPESTDALVFRDTSSGAVRHTVSARVDEEVIHYALSPDGKRLAALCGLWRPTRLVNMRVRVWDVEAGRVEKDIDLKHWHDRPTFYLVAFSDDGRSLALGGDRARPVCEVWDVEERRRVRTLKCPHWWWDTAPVVVEKDDGRILTPPRPPKFTPKDETVELARLLRNSGKITLPGVGSDRDRSFFSNQTLLSADGTTAVHLSVRLWSLKDDRYHIWDTATGTSREGTAVGIAGGVCLSPDGRLFVVQRYAPLRPAGNREFHWQVLEWLGVSAPRNPPVRQLCVVDLETGEDVACLPQGRNATFSPDGQTLAVIHTNRVELWDIPPRKPWGRIVLYGAAAFLAFFVLLLMLPRLLRLRGRCARPLAPLTPSVPNAPEAR